MNESRAGLLFIAPAVLLLAIFFFAPVIAGFALSLTDFDLYTIGDIHHLRFIALRNYSDLLGSGIFWTALGNTLYFSLVGGPLTVVVSLAAALLVNSKLTRFKSLFSMGTTRDGTSGAAAACWTARDPQPASSVAPIRSPATRHR